MGAKGRRTRREQQSDRRIVPSRDIYVCWQRGRQASGEFYDCLLDLQEAWGGLNRDVAKSGPLIAAGRNEQWRRWLSNTDAPWCLSLDADQELNPARINRLLYHAHPTLRPIVVPLIFGWNEQHRLGFPIIYKYANPNRPELGFVKVKDWPRGEVIEPDAGPGGCILIHRDAAEKIRVDADDKHYPWFREDVLGDTAVGEDMIFYHRARQAGFTITMDTAVVLGHDKGITVDERDYDPDKL